MCAQNSTVSSCHLPLYIALLGLFADAARGSYHGLTVSPRHDSGKDPATAEKARQAFFRNAPKKRKQQCLDYHCTYHCIVFKFLLLMSCWSSWKDVNKFQRVSSKKMSPWSPFSYTHSWQIFAFVITSILYGGTGEGRGTNRKTPIRGRKKWS